MKKIIFKGAATALATPFTNGGINYEEFKKLIENQIDQGIDSLVVCGTTGEASCMSLDEKKEAIKFVVDTVNRKSSCNCWYWFKQHFICNKFEYIRKKCRCRRTFSCYSILQQR